MNEIWQRIDVVSRDLALMQRELKYRKGGVHLRYIMIEVYGLFGMRELTKKFKRYNSRDLLSMKRKKEKELDFLIERIYIES